ncbi:SpaN/EivJ family type III secretion system needle length determinant [Dryocola sp. BD626]|uniref:SpaN/EivJ family type III secretion system needle length determinant n=1 Tax=Dryocola sp. BD626 TaxID=3133273 RepID=UPI003F500CE7
MEKISRNGTSGLKAIAQLDDDDELKAVLKKLRIKMGIAENEPEDRAIAKDPVFEKEPAEGAIAPLYCPTLSVNELSPRRLSISARQGGARAREVETASVPPSVKRPGNSVKRGSVPPTAKPRPALQPASAASSPAETKAAADPLPQGNRLATAGRSTPAALPEVLVTVAQAEVSSANLTPDTVRHTPTAAPALSETGGMPVSAAPVQNVATAPARHHIADSATAPAPRTDTPQAQAPQSDSPFLTYRFQRWGKEHAVTIQNQPDGQLLLQPSDVLVAQRLAEQWHAGHPQRWALPADGHAEQQSEDESEENK